MFSMRALKAFAKAPLIPPPTPVIVPLQTFRSYATNQTEEQSTPEPKGPKPKEKATSKNEQSSAGAPTTDDIAHSDAAYGGSGPNPEESAQGIEREKSQPGGMKSTPANPNVSKPPAGRKGKTA